MRRFAVLALLVGCLLVFAGICMADGLDLTPSPQTIGDLKTLPDGTHVSLSLENIVRISKSPTEYVVIQETLTNDRLSLLTIPNPLLRLTQIIDCTGDLITLPSGDRALVNVTIWGYASESGELLYHPAIIKGLSPDWDLPWPKIDLTVTASPDPGGSTMRSTTRSDSQNGALDYTPPADDTDTSTPQPTFYDTVDSVVNADPALAAESLIAFESKTILDSGVEDGTGFSYLDIIDDPAGTTSLRVYYDPNVYSNAASSPYINYVSGQLQDDGTGTLVLDCNSGPTYDYQLFVGILQPVGLIDYTTNTPKDTIAMVLAKPNGSPVDMTNPVNGPDNGKIVTATNTDFPGYIYIEEPSQSNGIRVNYTDTTGAISRGSKVLVTGTVSTGTDGEREIEAGTSGVSPDPISSTAPIPNPIGISGAALGGSPTNGNVTAITIPPYSIGCYNRGLLVRLFGQITYVDSSNGFFYIWDGSYLSGGTPLNDSSGNLGVKVQCGWPSGKTQIIPPQVGWYASVAGISGSERPSQNNYIRVLRPRDQNDVVIYKAGAPLGGTPTPAWAQDSTPSDSSPVGDGGPSSADSVDLASGAGENKPGPDILVNNPIGPDPVFTRMYRSTLAENSYASPGLSPGWVNNYDVRIQQGSNMTLFYPNGATEILSLSPNGSPYAVTASGTPSHWNWIKITFPDETSWQFNAPSQTSNTYLLTKVADILGNYISINRLSSTDARLDSVKDSTGKSLMSFSYSGAYLSTVSDVSVSGSTRQVTFTFSSQAGTTCLASVSQVNNASAPQWNYGYTAINNYPYLTWVEAPDPTGGPGMRGHPINYDGNGKVSSLADANGNKRSYIYNGTSTQVFVRDSTGALAQGWTQKIGPQHQDLGVIDASNNATSITYVGNYLPSTFTNKNNQTSMMKYDSDLSYPNYGRLRTVTDPRGLVTTYTYGDSNHPFRVTEEQTGTKTSTRFQYDSVTGLITEVDTPRPGTIGTGVRVATNYTYTTLGNVWTMTSPSDGTSSLTTVFDYTSDPDYSISGQTEALAQPLRVSVYEGPQSSGHVISRAHFRYDNLGRLWKVIDANNNVTTFGYNDDQLTDVWYPITGTGSSVSAHRIYTYLYPGGPLQNMSLYDESGNLFRQVAATNGNEAELLAQAGATLQTNYAYDAMYRAKHITDGNSHTTQFGYDPVGNPVSLTHPSGLAMTWKFDPDHNINKRIDSLNQVTNYTTDTTDSRLTDVNYPSGTSPQFQYDIYDRVIHMTDATGTFTYAYDDNDLLTTVTTSYAGLPTQTISYIYNPDGSRYTMTISGLSGSIVRSITYTYQYYYDTAHQMRAVSLLSPMFPQQADICYYDLNGRLSVRDIGYVKTTYTYDPRGRLASLSNDSPTYNFRLESYYTSIVHDAAGNLTDLDYNIPYAWYYYSYFQSLTGHTHYTYDTLDRLTGEQRTCSPSTYSYNVSFSPDVADNPLSMRGQSFTYNADNQIQGYAYNGNGDCTGFGNYGLTYDYEDLPKTLTWGTNTFPMQFRADGLRASKTRGSTTTYYLYDGKRVICEVDSQGYLASAYAYGLAGLGQRGVYTSDYGLKGPYIYTFDPLGSLVKSLYMSGVDGSFNYGSDRTAIYDAFGKRWWDNNGPGNTLYPGPASFDDSVGFQGQSGAYTDPETGSSWNGTSPLILMGVRYYDPTSGRFITRDPIGDDVNDYAYCGNNPVERTDPDGLSYLGDVGGVFVGYGQTIAAVVNPVGWYHGAKALCHMTRRYGVRKAASAVWQGTKKSFTAWATTSNPKEFGQSFGNILITGAAVAAPYAKAGQIAGEAAAIGKAGEAASAADKMRLALDMALEEAESGTGDVMAKGNKIHDIARLLRKGGEPSDWEKVTAPAHELPNGTKIQYHWYQNLRTGKRYDMKMKVVTPKWPKMR